MNLWKAVKTMLAQQPKRKFLVMTWEIVEAPQDAKTQMTPALAQAWVTPTYAQGVIEAGYNAKIVEA